jgi:hypothetical protein
VFGRGNVAVRIEQVIQEGRSGVPAATLRAIARGLAGVDRQLAATAVAATTDPGCIHWATQALKLGDQLLASGLTSTAIVSYGAAWKIAVRCVGCDADGDR